MAGSIKLYGPTGYTELAAGIGADDNVLTLPVSGSALASNVDLASKLDIAGGKILQIVRATDSTLRTTSSTSFVDASISVTISPQKNTSAILLLYTANVSAASNAFIFLSITDNSNNAISGSQAAPVGSTGGGNVDGYVTLFGYSTPSTISATTYKGRFRVSGGTGSINNGTNTSQLYAIEVSA
jgi:hypothetical protein